MGTYTAQIIVGTGHPNHDGIAPSHYLYLAESSRPAWVLVPDNSGGSQTVETKVTWIPTLENTLEDALLMIAIHVVKDEGIIRAAQEYFSSKENNWVVVYEDVSPEQRKQLYQMCRELENTFKLVLTVLRGSMLADQLKVLEQYRMDVEVCTPSYVRLYSRWLEQTRLEGEL